MTDPQLQTLFDAIEVDLRDVARARDHAVLMEERGRRAVEESGAFGRLRQLERAIVARVAALTKAEIGESHSGTAGEIPENGVPAQLPELLTAYDRAERQLLAEFSEHEADEPPGSAGEAERIAVALVRKHRLSVRMATRAVLENDRLAGAGRTRPAAGAAG